MNENELFDVIVIGGGPSGVTAAVYAARGGKKVKLFHTDASALAKAELIQNYYGFDAVGGAELYKRGLSQAESVGVSVELAEVTFVRAEDDGFTVSTSVGEYRSRKLVVATGARRRSAGIGGESEFVGRGVSYCAVCDAFFYRKKRVAVIGTGNYAVHEYSVISSVASEAYLLTNGEADPVGAIPPEKVVSGRIARIFGGERVEGVELVDGRKIFVDGVFIAVGVMGSAELARSVGVVTDPSGAIAVDGNGMTNVPGLYAAGDCISGVKQIGKAVSDGVRVGYALLKSGQ